jgi:hypothetical protein
MQPVYATFNFGGFLAENCLDCGEFCLASVMKLDIFPGVGGEAGKFATGSIPVARYFLS